MQWDAMDTWHYVLPPNRPTRAYLSFVKSIMASRKAWGAVAIMGATPELRDLVSRFDPASVLVLDKSDQFYRRMSNLCLHADTGREHFILGDWCHTFQLFPRYFDLILSDFTLGNIAYNDRMLLYSSLTHSLKAGGIFVDRVLTLEAGLITISQIEDIFDWAPYNLSTLNDFNAFAIFQSELLDRGLVESDTIYVELELRWHQKPWLRRFLADVKLITPAGATWYYGLPWDWVKGRYMSIECVTTCLEREPSAFANQVRYFVWRS